MAASPPLLVLPLLGSGNKGVKRDAKQRGDYKERGRGSRVVGRRMEETRIKAK